MWVRESETEGTREREIREPQQWRDSFGIRWHEKRDFLWHLIFRNKNSFESTNIHCLCRMTHTKPMTSCGITWECVYAEGYVRHLIHRLFSSWPQGWTLTPLFRLSLKSIKSLIISQKCTGKYYGRYYFRNISQNCNVKQDIWINHSRILPPGLFWIVPFYQFNQHETRLLINWAFHAAISRCVCSVRAEAQERGHRKRKRWLNATRFMMPGL